MMSFSALLSLLSLLLVVLVSHVQSSGIVVNDDYCDDLAEGADEPSTAACSHLRSSIMQLRFQCVDVQFITQSVFTSRINDGVCDCCDGSDETSGIVQCPKKCHEIGEERARAAAHKRKQVELGSVRKWDVIQKHAALLTDLRRSSQEKEVLLPRYQTELAQAKERLRREQQIEAGELQSRLGIAGMIFREAVESLVTPLDRQARISLVAALALRIKEDGTEELLATAEGKHTLPGDGEVDDTEAIVLAMDSPEGNDDSIESAKVITSDVLDAMTAALALHKLADDSLAELLEGGLGLARARNVARLALRDAQIVVTVLPSDFPQSPAEIKAKGFFRPETGAAKEAIMELERRIESLNLSSAEAEKISQLNFGPSDELFSWYHYKTCFNFQSKTYSYSICPFAEARQQQTLMGSHAGGRVTLRAGVVESLAFEGGERCVAQSDRRERSLLVNLVCADVGAETGYGRITDVFETEACVYQAVIETPLVC